MRTFFIVATFAIAALWFAAPAHAAISLVQVASSTQTSANFCAATFSSPVTAGDLIIYNVSWGSTTTQLTNMRDTLGNATASAYGPIWGGTANYQAQSFYIWNSLGGADTVSSTLSSNRTVQCIAAEYSGVQKTSDPLEATTTNFSTVNRAIATTSVITTANADLLASYAKAGSSETWTAGTGYTLEGSTRLDAYQDQIQAAAGDASATITFNVGSSWELGLAAFKPASGGGSATTTTLGNGTEPAGVTIGPGANATTSDVFTFVTSAGTSTITGVTTTLSTVSGVYQIQIADNSGAVVYGSSTNPSTTSNFISLSGMNVSSSATTFRVLVAPLSATNMPAPPGGAYVVTSTIAGFTDGNGNTKAGSNTTSSVITIDNASPGNVTNASGTATSSQVALSWTNPADADLSGIIVLRATSSISAAPTEGASYNIGNIIGPATVACATTGGSCTDTGLTNSTVYYYKIFTFDAYGNYSTGVVPVGNPFTPGSPSAVSGNLDSATFDTGVASGSQFNSILWQGSEPVGTDVRFQFAVSNSSSGPWTFIGPSGDSGTYYSPLHDTTTALDYSLFNNYRYFRYRVTLVSDTNKQYTPQIDEVFISWSP